MPDSPVLQTRDLASHRGDRTLFSGLSFELGAGGLLHVRGANGSGKTTLLRVLCGLIHPDDGEILWHGTRIDRRREAYRRDIHYVGHLNGVKPELTPMENLRFAEALNGRGGDPAAALERMHLFGFEHEPARTLSAGQRRRIALARLLLSPARVWVLDEPFTALDVTGIGLLETMIHEHIGNGGLIAMASHSTHGIDSRHVQELYLAN